MNTSKMYDRVAATAVRHWLAVILGAILFVVLWGGRDRGSDTVPLVPPAPAEVQRAPFITCRQGRTPTTKQMIKAGWVDEHGRKITRPAAR